MSSEIKTTTSTGAGLMERKQAQWVATAMINSRLWDAVRSQESTGASVTQFDVFPAPGASVSAATEADAVGKTAVTISAVTATLAMFPFVTNPSYLYLGGGENAELAVDTFIINEVISSIDKHIASVITTGNFTATPLENVTSLDALITGAGILDDTGFTGTKYFIGSGKQCAGIIASAKNAFIPNKNEEMIRTGKIGSIMDVEIRKVPSSWLPSVSGEKAGLIYFKEWAIGFAYRAAQFGGLVRRAEVEAHTAKEISGVAICKSAALAATAGIICKSGSAS